MTGDSVMVAPAGPTRPLCSGRSGLPVAPDDLSPDSFGQGIFPDLDRLSLTDCPVHASLTAQEWIEMAWAARDASLRARNLERRGWFEGVKCLLFERDLPASRIFNKDKKP